MNTFFRKFLVSIAAFSFFASCGSDTATVWLEEKILDNFSISIPSSWVLISKDSDNVPAPSAGEIVLIASAPEPKNGFANNIVILEREALGQTNAKQYMEAGKTGLEKQFYSFKQLGFTDIEFSDKWESSVLSFLARYNKNTPRANYIQTARICSNKAYTITLTLAEDVIDFSRYIEFLSTFSCKD